MELTAREREFIDDESGLTEDVVEGAQSLRADPNLREALERGETLALAGDVEAAAASFREALRLDPRSADAHHRLGKALVLLAQVSAGRGGASGAGAVKLGRDESRLDEGLEHLARAVELEPSNLDFLYEHGRTLHIRGRHAEAVAALEALIARAPDDGRAHKRLGLVHLDRGDIERALASLRAAEPLLESDPGICFQIGNALVEEDPAAARDAFERSLAVDPSFAGAYYGLASVLGRLGDPAGAQAAREEYERWRRFAVRGERAERRAEKRPDDVSTQLAVGDLFFEHALWRRARPKYHRVLELDPRHAQAHYRLGRIARELGETERARNHLEEALFLTPDALEPRFELLRLCHATGDRERSDALLTDVRRFEESLSSDDRAHVADVLVEVGRADEARRHYRAVLESEPEHAAAREGLERLDAGG